MNQLYKNNELQIKLAFKLNSILEQVETSNFLRITSKFLWSVYFVPQK